MKTIEIKGHAKGIYFSSEGIGGIKIKETGEEIYFYTDRCSKIVGLTEYVSCWFCNNLKTYTPIEITTNGSVIHISFPLEGIEIITEIAEEGAK